MKPFGPVAHPEHLSELTEPSPRQPIAAGEMHDIVVEALMQRQRPLAVGRIPLVVAAVALEHALVRAGVDVVDARPEGRDATGDERFLQPFGRQRQVRDHAHAAEALPEHAPALDAQLAADPLGVADDRIGAEVREIVGLLLRAHSGERSDRRRAAGATLVEHQDAELPQRPIHPAGIVRAACRARRLESRAALEVHEQRPLPAIRVGELAREHRDPFAGLVVVIERDLERMLDNDQAGKQNLIGHR